MANSGGGGGGGNTWAVKSPGVRTKKEGKCPVLRQHCNIFHRSHSRVGHFKHFNVRFFVAIKVFLCDSAILIKTARRNHTSFSLSLSLSLFFFLYHLMNYYPLGHWGIINSIAGISADYEYFDFVFTSDQNLISSTVLFVLFLRAQYNQ